MKALRLKDQILCLYADYSQISMIHMESSGAYKYVLDLSNKLKNNKQHDTIIN